MALRSRSALHLQALNPKRCRKLRSAEAAGGCAGSAGFERSVVPDLRSAGLGVRVEGSGFNVLQCYKELSTSLVVGNHGSFFSGSRFLIMQGTLFQR